MSAVTVGYGATLVVLGAAGYYMSGKQSKTALIPAGFGAVELGLGLLAGRPRWGRVALGGALAVSVVAVAGSLRGVKKLPALLRGEEVERPAAVIAQSVMAGLSAGHSVWALVRLLR